MKEDTLLELERVKAAAREAYECAENNYYSAVAAVNAAANTVSAPSDADRANEEKADSAWQVAGAELAVAKRGFEAACAAVDVARRSARE